MGAVWLVFGTKLRRHWRSWLLLSLLIAVASGFVLVGTAAAAAPTRPSRAMSPATDTASMSQPCTSTCMNEAWVRLSWSERQAASPRLSW